MDQYERLKALGQGSFGTALLVRERRSGRRGQYRVIKEIDLTRMPVAEQAEAQSEANVLRQLSHINIIAYIDTFIEDVKLHIVMEFADGGDLSKVIKQYKEESRRFNQDEVLSIFMQCCFALQHTHSKHVLHRDLKSQNIFMTKGGVVKLGDFGIAKVLDHTAAEAMTVIGTPNYLSPEVVDNKPYGIKADIWSLGVVLYELLVLEPPFQGNCLAALVVKIVTNEPKPIPTELYSEDVRQVVTWCLQKVPEKRPTADDLLGLPVLRHGIGLLPPVVAEAREASSSEAKSPSHANTAARPKEAKSSLPRREAAAPARGSRRRESSGSKRRPPSHSSTPRSAVNAASADAGPDCSGGDAVDEFLLNRQIAARAKQRAEVSSVGRRGVGGENPARLGGQSGASGKGHQWPPARSARQEAPSPVAMAEECRRNRELARQTRARVEGEVNVQYATPERGDGCENTPAPGSAVNSARERAREKREAEEELHRQALLQAAAQARLDRKFVQNKMQELDRGNSSSAVSVSHANGAAHSLDTPVSAKQQTPSAKEEQQLNREADIEESRRMARASHREVRSLRRPLASPGLLSDYSPAADVSSNDVSGLTPMSAAVAAVSSAAAAAAEASFRHCLLGRFNAAAEDAPLHGGAAHPQPMPVGHAAGAPRNEVRRDSRRGKSSIGLVGGMVAAVNSRPVTADVNVQVVGAAGLDDGVDLLPTLCQSPDEMQGADHEHISNVPQEMHVTLKPGSHDTLEDLLVDELSRRCGASPPRWQPTCRGLAAGARPASAAESVHDEYFVDDDAMSDSWHAAKEVTEQAAATLEYSLTMPLAPLPQVVL